MLNVCVHHPCVCFCTCCVWMQISECTRGRLTGERAQHVPAVTGVQTVTWLLWSALTTNEKRQTITGGGGGGTLYSITTKPMTCHLFNNIYSAEDCNPGHLRRVSLKCHVLVTSQPLRQASKTNISKRHRRIRISHFFTCNIASPLLSGDKKKKKNLDAAVLMSVYDASTCHSVCVFRVSRKRVSQRRQLPHR